MAASIEAEDSGMIRDRSRSSRLVDDSTDTLDSDYAGVFTDESREGEGRSRRFRISLIPGIFAAILLSACGALVFYAFSWSQDTTDPATLPVVTANDGPLKVKPENEGGMAVPHQDKLILNQIAEAESAQAVEHLLPPPEAPQVVEAAAIVVEESEPIDGTDDGSNDGLAIVESTETDAGAVGGAATAEAAGESDDSTDAIAALIETAKDKTAENQAAVEPPSPPEAEAVAEAPKTEPEKAAIKAVPKPKPVQKAAVPKEEPKAETKPAPAAAQPKAGNFMVQLAAVKSGSSGAEAEWNRLRGSHLSLLSDLSLRVEKAVVNGTTYHRVQAGPMTTRAAADGLCQKLKAASQPCLVKKVR